MLPGALAVSSLHNSWPVCIKASAMVTVGRVMRCYLKKYRLPCPDCSSLLHPDIVAPVMLPGWPQIITRDRVLVPCLPGPEIHVGFYRIAQYCEGMKVEEDPQHIELDNRV